MDLARLRTLRELSVRQTMAAVAEAMRISPSAVSQQLAQLEDEVGIQLLERRGRGVRLTAAGVRLASDADRIIAIVEGAKADLAEMKHVVAGELRVAAFPSVAAALLPQTIRNLAQSHPQLGVTFEELEPMEGLWALRAWQTDAAIIDDLNVPAGAIDAAIETQPIIQDVFHVMLPMSHRLAGQATVTLKHLRREKWAIDTASTTYTQMLVEACRKAGFEPDIIARSKGLEVTLSLVRGGCAIAISPGLRANNDLHDVRVKKLAPEIRRTISVAYRRSERRHPALAALLREIEQVAALHKRSAARNSRK